MSATHFILSLFLFFCSLPCPLYGQTYGLKYQLGAGPNMGTINSSFYRWDSVNAPPSWSWRSSPLMTPVATQFDCASCWAITAADAVAIMWSVAKNQPGFQASPQQICDCATKQCCQGGSPEWGLSYILFNGGVNSWANYAYKARDFPTCQSNLANSTLMQITGWELIPAYDISAFMKAVYKYPVIALISMTGDLTSFRNSSVYNGNCTNELNHAVIIVGYDARPTTPVPYWIVKNSWGPTWGTAGFAKIAMLTGAGKCGITSSPGMFPVYYPVALPRVLFSPKKSPVKPDSLSQYSANNFNGNAWSPNSLLTVVGNPCSGIVNPCGAGSCYTGPGNVARCKCPPGFLERLEQPTSKCVRNPCARLFNPCGNGACSVNMDGSYNCNCSTGYVMGSRAFGGGPTCVAGGVLGGSQTYSTIPGDTCQSVAAMFGLTVDNLVSMNNFLNCTDAFLAPGLALIFNYTTTGSSCIANYVVNQGDTVDTIASNLQTSIDTLTAANPGVDVTNLLPGQSICGTKRLVRMSDLPPQCTQTYTTGMSDTCDAIVAKFSTLNSISDLNGMNPGLDCTVGILPYGLSICISNSTFLNVVNCTQTYNVTQGDTCPSIWNAANLTQSAFIAMNSGLQCNGQLQVGTTVCISSPQAAPFLVGSDQSFAFPYTISLFDTLASISQQFRSRCSGAATPNSICLLNNFTVCDDSVLPNMAASNTVIMIPCARPVGSSCYCSNSVWYCGGDFTTYYSYCDANCNFATPGVQMVNGCNTCQTFCQDRHGLAPNFPQDYSNYVAQCGNYWNGGSGSYVCRYPTWTPTNPDWVVGSGSWLPIYVNCAYQNRICQDVCTQVANKKQAAGSLTFDSDFLGCYTSCYVKGTGCTPTYTSRPVCQPYGTCLCTGSLQSTCL